MERAGKKVPPLSYEELAVIFELVHSGGRQKQARNSLINRDRVTVNRAFNVVSEFSRMNISQLDEEAAQSIAEKSRYSTTTSYVRRLFLQWRGWLQKGLPSMRDDPLSRVREEATLRHVARIAETAKTLDEQLHLPNPEDAGSWPPQLDNEKRIAPVWTGSFDLLNQPWWSWKPEERGKATFQLLVEQKEFFSFLQEHVPDDGRWGLLMPWKEGASNYLHTCHRLVQTIVREVWRQTDTNEILIEQWPQVGIFWAFAARVYWHHLMLTRWPSGKGLNGLSYRYEQSPSRVVDQGNIWTLWHGGDGIACHQSKELLEEWEGAHKILLAELDYSSCGKALLVHHKKLEDLIKPLKNLLQAEMDRGMFDGGRCLRCP